MRPEFRFPRSAILLMLVSLGMIVVTIEKTRQIASYSSATTYWFVVFGRVIMLGCAFMCVSGAIGYGVLVVLRRSNVHSWIQRR